MNDNQIKKYWDAIGKSPDVNWHIIHISEEEEFFKSGEISSKNLFGANLELLPETGKVLDLGCGKGRILRYLAMNRNNIDFLGLDVSKEMITGAIKANCHLGLMNLRFVVGDGYGLQVFDDNYFDVVFSYVVFQHLPRKLVDDYMSECARVLKDDGKMIFQVQTKMTPQEIDPSDNDFRSIRYYTDEQAKNLPKPPMKVIGTRGKPYTHDYFIICQKISSENSPSV